MIPLHLHISGFLSYHDPIELDFESFSLACISGQNGAGKSSLLDSITWVLFGEARGRGAEIINLNQDVKAAEVALQFEYEGNIYRVQRTLPRTRSTMLEFQVRDHDAWRPLTEKTTRETQARIEQILRMDYETFINASFFLQGKADQFTQKKSGERKAILSTILGLEMWETYKERAAERRRGIENEVHAIDGRMVEIDAELSEEENRRNRLAEVENTLQRQSAARLAQESLLDDLKKAAALLEEQRNMATNLAAGIERSRTALAGLESRLGGKAAEQNAYAELLGREKEIEDAYSRWQEMKAGVEQQDRTALQFREHEKNRSPLLETIAAERARLEQEQRSLLAEDQAIRDQTTTGDTLAKEIEKAALLVEEVEHKLRDRKTLEGRRNAAREKQAELRAENESLKAAMAQLKERIDSLKSAQGAECPLCGQPLSKEHRKTTLEQLEKEGREKGDRFRSNKSSIGDLDTQIAELETAISSLSAAETERLKYSNMVSQLTERMEALKSLARDWKHTGRKRLAEVTRHLDRESFAEAERKKLARLDKELARLGYDASAHDDMRREEAALRAIEGDHRKLDSARQVMKQIEGEISSLEADIANRRSEILSQEEAYKQLSAALKDAESKSPDLHQAETKWLTLREEENRVRDEAGAARQKVDVLSTLHKRKSEFETGRKGLNLQIARLKSLERAFGKDGVPALLIEQALPQIESKANDLLDRLSGGQMSVRFITQEAYRDKKRDDLRETLDIQISDPAGTRDYEMFSGGEAFRVNFAIRLALSEILTQRKGARLQTLVIDEGFGSQDAQGRQRLIEAINQVRDDFAKILVITHLDELKDAFPNRIEVEKTGRGSTLRVI